MAYFLFTPNNSFNSNQTYNCSSMNYVYATFDTFTNYGALVSNPSYLNLQSTYLNPNWFPSQIKIKDIFQNVNDKQSIQTIQKTKNSSKIKNNLKHKNINTQLQSAKKNCQSNLVNQFLSYFSSYSNSSAMIIAALKKMKLKTHQKDQKKLEQITILFCKQVSIVNSRRQRKYVNKSFLQNYFQVQKLIKYMPDILEKVQRSNLITDEQFCELFRRVCYNFFRTISISSVTSSAKLNVISRPQHIKRRRLIVQTLGKVAKLNQ